MSVLCLETAGHALEPDPGRAAAPEGTLRGECHPAPHPLRPGRYDPEARSPRRRNLCRRRRGAQVAGSVHDNLAQVDTGTDQVHLDAHVPGLPGDGGSDRDDLEVLPAFRPLGHINIHGGEFHTVPGDVDLHLLGEEAFTQGIFGHLHADVMDRLHLPEVQHHLHFPAAA